MTHALALVSPTHQPSTRREPSIAQRLVLYHGELYRVPTAYHLLRIQSGTAYVTQSGQDRVLACGEMASLDANADVALISALAGDPVILELFQRNRER
ncbi:hypothetical protein BH10CHL1_BH10CHL1_11200 [soil metagenome]